MTTIPVDDSADESASSDLAPTGVAGLGPLVSVAVAVLILDQVTKIWAVAALADGHIDLIWTLRLRLIYNTGSAFGLAEGQGHWLGLVIVVVVGFMIRWARRVDDARIRILLGAILGGALGNLADRLFRAEDGFLTGGVVDFFDLQWWPVFNVADIAIVCGAIGLGLVALKEPAPEST